MCIRRIRPTTKAKPNTRFLRNIIKQTESHNEALTAKEAAEAQARLDALAAAKAREERKHRPGAQDLRRRQLGIITATLGGKKRKLAADEEEGAAGQRDLARADARGKRSARHDGPTERADNKTDREPAKDRHRTRDRDQQPERRHRTADRSPSPDDAKSSRKRSRPDRSRSRSRSPGYKERKHRSSSHRHSNRYRDRASPEDDADTDKRSTSHRKHRSDRHRRDHDRDRDEDTHTSPPRSQHRHKRRDPSQDRTHKQDKQDDSDPLDEIIGPLPPSPANIRRKGRGAASGPSAMDSRFSADYDPKSDIGPDPDVNGDKDDDWADSLEALRDRERWRRQGAERLRAAGFTEEQVRAWEGNEKGGREKSAEDVRWAKEGEGREWDRGKKVVWGDAEE